MVDSIHFRMVRELSIRLNAQCKVGSCTPTVDFLMNTNVAISDTSSVSSSMLHAMEGSR